MNNELQKLIDLLKPSPSVAESTAHEAIDMKMAENDLYQLAKEKQLSGSTYMPGEIRQPKEVKGGLGALEAIMPPISIKSLADAFKLAKRFKGLDNIPAYLRSPWAKEKGFRKVGITTGRATPNDPMFEALKKFDSKGEKIPPSRMIDFLLKK
mgnify:CR=1 FL=1